MIQIWILHGVLSLRIPQHVLEGWLSQASCEQSPSSYHQLYRSRIIIKLIPTSCVIPRHPIIQARILPLHTESTIFISSSCASSSSPFATPSPSHALSGSMCQHDHRHQYFIITVIHHHHGTDHKQPSFSLMFILTPSPSRTSSFATSYSSTPSWFCRRISNVAITTATSTMIKLSRVLRIAVRLTTRRWF